MFSQPSGPGPMHRHHPIRSTQMRWARWNWWNKPTTFEKQQCKKRTFQKLQCKERVKKKRALFRQGKEKIALFRKGKEKKSTFQKGKKKHFSETEKKKEHFSERAKEKLLLFHSLPRVKGLAKGLFEKTLESFRAPGQTSLCPEEKNVKRKFEIWQRPYYNNISSNMWVWSE